MAKIRIKYLIEDGDRHGNIRLYYRPPAWGKHRVPGPLGSDLFWAKLRPLIAAFEAGDPPPTKARKQSRQPVPKSIHDLVTSYFLHCDEYKAAGNNWRTTQRRYLDLITGSKYGHLPYTEIRRRHILKLRDELVESPGGKNALVKHVKRVFSWAQDRELLHINPARRIKPIKIDKSHHTMAADEIRQYLDRHGAGSKARMGLAMGLFTGLRVSDLSRLGRQHFRDGWMRLEPTKTARTSGITVEMPVHQILQQEIDRLPKTQLTLMITEYGRPYSVKGLANRYKDWMIQAGLPHCSSHSMRKGASANVAENGGSTSQLQALFGWTTLEQPRIYTKQANRKKMAAAAVEAINFPGTEWEQKSPTLRRDSSPVGLKSQKNQ